MTLDLDALEAQAESFPELNPNNCSEEDVLALNNWGIEIALSLPSLIAELRSARQDAERYRWLRDECPDTDIRAALAWIADAVSPASVDLGIDAAIEASK